MNRIQKTIRRRRQKHQHQREVSLKLIELKKLITDVKNKIDALKQIIWHVEEVKGEVKLKNKELKEKIKNNPSENPFDLTESVETQKGGNEIDLGLFLELAEENKNICNQVPLNTLIEDMEKKKGGFFTNGYFNLDDKVVIETYRFFKDSSELAKFVEKKLTKMTTIFVKPIQAKIIGISEFSNE